MRRTGIINPSLSAAISALCHTERFLVADAGLPVPRGVEVIDLSVVHGLPPFLDVLRAVLTEVVIEGSVIAEEIVERNPSQFEALRDLPVATTGRAASLLGETWETVPHERFKRLVGDAKFVVRTGEATPYSNIVLAAGVPF